MQLAHGTRTPELCTVHRTHFQSAAHDTEAHVLAHDTEAHVLRFQGGGDLSDSSRSAAHGPLASPGLTMSSYTGVTGDTTLNGSGETTKHRCVQPHRCPRPPLRATFPSRNG